MLVLIHNLPYTSHLKLKVADLAHVTKRTLTLQHLTLLKPALLPKTSHSLTHFFEHLPHSEIKTHIPNFGIHLTKENNTK